MAQTEDTQGIVVLNKTVGFYLQGIAFTSNIPEHTIAHALWRNSVTAEKLSPETLTQVKDIFAKEAAVTNEAINRYVERQAAVHAKNPDARQQQLMKEHGLWRETWGVTLLTLGFNQIFNITAESAAVRKDLPEIVAQHGYDIKAGRATLDKYGLANIYQI